LTAPVQFLRWVVSRSAMAETVILASPCCMRRERGKRGAAGAVGCATQQAPVRGSEWHRQ
jgi:hypothetical protein